MKRVIIVHRWAGGALDDWRPWLKVELEKRGYEVLTPTMPDTETPVIEKWVSHLSNVVGTPNSDTYFIGHSIGCQSILRYLETINTSVAGAIFVAGWFNLENLEDEETKEIAKPWIQIPINIEKIKKVLAKAVLIISKNDPFGAFDENVKKFSEVGAEIVTLESAGHITQKEVPEILEQFISKFEVK